MVDEIDFARVDSRIVLTNTPERDGLELPTREQMEAAIAAAAAANLEPWVDTVREEPLIAELPEPGSVLEERHDEDLDLTTWRLSNGVTVLVKPTDFNEDRFTLEAFSPGGTSLGSSPVEISEVLATSFVQSGGVGSFDATELRKRLTGKIAQANAWIGGFEEGFSGGGSPDDLETAMQLLWLSAMQPRRDEEAFTSLLDRFATMLENRSMNPDQVYSDSLTVILYGNHPDARPLDVDRLRTSDLDRSLDFYRDRFEDLDDLVVVIVGAVELETLRPLVEQYLATLPRRTARKRGGTTACASWRARCTGSSRPAWTKKARTTLVMHGDAEWTRKNRYALGALASALDIRLREVLREDLSGTYGVSVSGSTNAWPAPHWRLTVSFGCEPSRLDELVAQAIGVLEEVRDEGLDPSYLQKVREQDLRANEENVRTNRYWSSVISFRERHGIDQRGGTRDPGLHRGVLRRGPARGGPAAPPDRGTHPDRQGARGGILIPTPRSRRTSNPVR